MADKFIRRLFSLILIFLVLVPNFIIPVAADTEAKMVFTKNFIVQVNSVDTNIDGSLTFAGLNNGSIICMNKNGEVIYNYLVYSPTNAAIQKIEADDNGYVAFLTKGGDNGMLNPSGGQIGYFGGWTPGFKTQDISVGKTNLYWFASYNTTTYNMLYGFYGTSIPYQLQTANGQIIHPEIAYDSVNGLVVANNINLSFDGTQPTNKIFLYNVTNYTGWIGFNPAKVTKNTTLQFLDSFPYRHNISYNNGDTATVGAKFLECYNSSTSCQNITMNSNGTFMFNVTLHGNYFFWGYPNSVNTTQKYVNSSIWNTTSHQYIVTTFPSVSPGDNMTFYYGRPSYTNSIINSSISYRNNNTAITEYITSGSTWTVPTGVQGVNLTMYGGGGGGSAGQDYESTGDGGDASSVTTYTLVKVVPGSYANITIGAGGAGSTPAWTPPTADGSTGGTTTFSNGTAYSATGGAGGHLSGAGTGGAGYTGYAGYPTASTGQNGQSKAWNCAGNSFVTYGGAGGAGFGAGGGGGGGSNYPHYYCSNNLPGNGGTGAQGLIIVSYLVNDIPVYYDGTTPNSPLLSTRQNVTMDSTISSVQNLTLTGNATSIAIPEGGGIVGVGTTGPNPSANTGKIYHIEITQLGFGGQSSADTVTGSSNDLSVSDGATFSIEARGSKAQIYALDGTLEGDYATGGTVNSVDIADRNGLLACAGGNDGIFYIFDKLLVSQWEVYFQGDAVAPILAVAISEGGEYAAVGRSDGSFEYYNTRSPISAVDAVFSVDVFVTKGGSSYPYINVSITQLVNGIPVLGSNVTNRTDTNGKYVFTATEQQYYLINVNDGEHTQIYQASPSYRVVSINLAYPLMTRPFQYGATYDSTSNVITSTYADVNNAYVNLSVIDTASKTLIYTQTYPSTTGFTNNYVVPDANRTYQVQYNIVRTTGAKYDDTIYLQSTSFYKIPQNTSDQYTLFIYAVYTLMLMVVALSIGTQSLKYGTVMLVALTFLGITLGFLPLSLYTAGIATSAFIALLEVYRRRE